MVPATFVQRTGGNVTVTKAISRAASSMLVVLVIIMAGPAAAQITFGSPADLPRVALGGGAFDVLPNAKKPGAGATGLVFSEYRFGDVLWIIAPFVGVMGTGKGAFYGYGGFGFDINIAE